MCVAVSTGEVSYTSAEISGWGWDGEGCGGDTAWPWSGSFLQHIFCPSSVTVILESFWAHKGSRSSCPVGDRAGRRQHRGGGDEGRAQLCCNVFDSIGGAESYRVSVSCVGSPANVHGLDSVPAPQSQKNLSCLINSTSCPW